MKRLSIVLGFCFLLGTVTTSADAKYPRGGIGVAGKVLHVGDRFFTYDTDQYGVVKVYVSANTNFQKNRRPATSAELKEGVSVRVVGHVLSPGIWESWTVNVTEK